ncbi:hypothetical protein KIPB_003265, partial [Kipferlia bialata]|eukprot:g3265.t1
MVRTYPFVLDPFQMKAVGAIHRDESVLVSAHTSAGKTVVAEYAIASALAKGQRVIYTSPIKALSNQKYRDLARCFPSVGLMTGDTTVNEGADCMVMTTEILRSMLFQGAELMRTVGWVIFDEIHYMTDAERGVVWEETIVQLPHRVRYVFLSATIPNAEEFAGWISRVHEQRVHVVYTEYRPVPLRHFILPVGADGLFLLLDETKKFYGDNLTKATAIASKLPNDGKGQAARKMSDDLVKKTLLRTIQLLVKKDLCPTICFAFGKVKCEKYAQSLNVLKLLKPEEQELFDTIFDNAVQVLPEEDRNLNMVKGARKYLRNGIGIHHSGLLPWLKELTEILFQEGLVKVLFATETFAMGLNLPARTVVFTELTKFDGVQSRHLAAGEYIQMAGRAGRRGLDTQGIVVSMLQPGENAKDLGSVVRGKPNALNSAFRVSFSMVLNMRRQAGADPEHILRNSLLQYQNQASLPKTKLELLREAATLNQEGQQLIDTLNLGVRDHHLAQEKMVRDQAARDAAQYQNRGMGKKAKKNRRNKDTVKAPGSAIVQVPVTPSTLTTPPITLEDIAEYCGIQSAYNESEWLVRRKMTEYKNLQRHMAPGKIVYIRACGMDFGPAIVTSHKPYTSRDNRPMLCDGDRHCVDVVLRAKNYVPTKQRGNMPPLLHPYYKNQGFAAPGDEEEMLEERTANGLPIPCSRKEGGALRIPVTLSCIAAVCRGSTPGPYGKSMDEHLLRKLETKCTRSKNETWDNPWN